MSVSACSAGEEAKWKGCRKNLCFKQTYLHNTAQMDGAGRGFHTGSQISTSPTSNDSIRGSQHALFTSVQPAKTHQTPTSSPIRERAGAEPEPESRWRSPAAVILKKELRDGCFLQCDWTLEQRCETRRNKQSEKHFQSGFISFSSLQIRFSTGPVSSHMLHHHSTHICPDAE